MQLIIYRFEIHLMVFVCWANSVIKVDINMWSLKKAPGCLKPMLWSVSFLSIYINLKINFRKPVTTFLEILDLIYSTFWILTKFEWRYFINNKFDRKFMRVPFICMSPYIWIFWIQNRKSINDTTLIWPNFPHYYLLTGSRMTNWNIGTKKPFEYIVSYKKAPSELTRRLLLRLP